MLTSHELDLLSKVGTDAGWSLVEIFAKTRREQPEEFDRGAAILAERIQSSGLNLKQHTPSIYLGVPRAATIRCEGRSYRTKVAALSPNQEAFTAPLVHVPAREGAGRAHTNDPALIFGDGHTRESLKALVEGRIVITEGLSNPGRSELLQALGARAIITANPGKAVHWGASSVVWGNPTMEDVFRLPSIVSMAVCKDDGLALAAAATRGVNITISADVLHGWFPQAVTTVDIEASGPHAHEFVLIHGHLDSWDLGVGDNATGNATLLEVARALNAQRHTLKRSIRVAWWPGHSAGRYAGSTWYADQFAFDLHKDCVAHLDCDSPGCKDATDYSSIRGMAEAQPLVASTVKDLFGQSSKLERPGRGGDYSFSNLGLTGAFLTSSMIPADERKRRGWYSVGGNGGSPTWHTEDDVFEVADRQVLSNDIKLYTLAAARLAAVETPMLDYRIPLRDIQARVEQVQTQAGHLVDLSVHLQLISKLQEQLGACYVDGSSTPASDRYAAVRAASRSIVRAGYVEKGAFEQDPAFQKPSVPMLCAAAHLQSNPHAPTSLLRGANNLRSELEQAFVALT